MSHFAHINEERIVDQVIVIEQEVLEQNGGWEVSGKFAPFSEWLQTSYNTSEGVHKLGGEPLRKNYAGIGYTHDKELDAFIPPKQYESWVLDKETCVYKAPIEKPDDAKIYNWDEEKVIWVAVPTEELSSVQVEIVAMQEAALEAKRNSK